jgi:NAD(P)-dependent dehydrogenase (short-subunit alcohol dehydrogenase family)
LAPGSRPELEPLALGDDLRKGRIAEEPIMYRSFGCKMPIVPLRHLATKGQRGLARQLEIGVRVELSGKVALVTGSSRGIGRHIARELAAKGARVAVHYRADREAAQETLDSLGGGPHAVFGADVADADSARGLVEGVARGMGSIDVLVNNAAIFEAHPVPEVDFASWQDAWSRTIATNLIGPANLSFLTARIMMERGGGRVVNVSSRGAFRGEPETPAYGASKAGLNAMSQSLAQALAPHGVVFYVVAPGFVETDMAHPLLSGPEGEGIRSQSPLGRVAEPEEVARTVAFLASEAPEFMTGAIVDVNGASYLRS